MITIEEAEKILSSIKVTPERETVRLSGALNRILAEDIASPIAIPPFNKAAMDGYAINSTDTSSAYRIIEIIPAGKVPRKKIGRGECSKIMTGGIVPTGADRVVMREVTVEENGMMRMTGKDPLINICFKGEDIKPGDTVLLKGTILRPQEIAVCASVGRSKIPVFKQPCIGLIATGSELVEPGKPLPEGKIYNSNSYSLAAQVEQVTGSVVTGDIAGDDTSELKTIIKKKTLTSDLLLISGGVSAGDYDYVPEVLEECGVTLHFRQIAIKPGKPTVFGSGNTAFFFGVPGNPVSTFVIFELFIKPFLYRLMGHIYDPVLMHGVLRKDITRKSADRTGVIPVYYRAGTVEKLSYHGSAHIHALSRANGLLTIPGGIHTVSAGSEVNVRLI
jgi:molybdopterin molybdotransferase